MTGRATTGPAVLLLLAASAPAGAQGTSEPVWGDLLAGVVLVASSLAIGWVAFRVLFAALVRAARFTEGQLDDLVVRKVEGPLRFIVPLATLGLALSALPLGEEARGLVLRVHSVGMIVAVAWLCFGIIELGELLFRKPAGAGAPDAIARRAVHTQAQVFRNVARFTVAVFAAGLILMSIPQVRQLGVSLLASAGVAGVVLGIAAQRSLATLIAGVQIGLTQPVRVGDVVQVEGEYGWIEEITLTYVVVRVWDRRRIVVPITWFVDHPFQNWTRTSSEFLATVFVHVDYSAPLGAIREALGDYMRTCELWDGRHWRLEVVDTTEHTMRLRAAVSIADPSVAWRLSCEVTEHLITWLQEHHPESLPRLRTALDRPRLVHGLSPPAGGGAVGVE